MNTQLASEVLERGQARRSLRARAVAALGPLAVLAGIAWALFQPYRITLLHPFGQGFWWLAIEPPLLVIAVGFLFSLLVAPGVIEDLEAAEEEAEG
jgi:hypothetical protein